jgi:uncharacterized LabA/DUF88 family protein
MKSAILVDEMNVMVQLHRLGIKGIKPWTAFYDATQRNLNMPTEYHLYGANVPAKIHPERHRLRSGFFRALKRDGITVHEGFSVLDRKSNLVEKGVDVLLSLDLSGFALEGYKDIVVASADGDLVPAIERAQRYGSRVHVLVSKHVPAAHITQAADSVIHLEDIVKCISPKHIVQQPFDRGLKTFKESEIA